MKRKIIGILIVTLLIATAFPAMGFEEENERNIVNNSENKKCIISFCEVENNALNNDFDNLKGTHICVLDELDQYQTTHDDDYLIGSDVLGYRLAQSFKPSFSTLTKFSLYLSSTMSVIGWHYFSYQVSLKKDSLNSADLLYGTVSTSSLTMGHSFWLNMIVSSPLAVTPGDTYYIVIYGLEPGTMGEADLYWYIKRGGTAYANGDGHLMDQPDPTWWPIFGGGDFCFKTYGEAGGGNNPPNTPDKPTGQTTGNVGTSYSYSTSADDYDGDQVQYRFDWDASGFHDYSGWTSLDVSGHSDSLSNSWSAAGTYVVKAQARDEHNDESGWSNGLTVTISAGNNAPDKPDTPSGQTNGKTGTSYTYSTSTDDPDGDQVWYKWDWGDEVSNWDGPYNSGDTVITSHTWSNQGTYAVKVKAKDTSDVESVWSDPLSVSMPKNKLYLNTPFLRFLENHPYMFPLLRQLLGLEV